VLTAVLALPVAAALGAPQLAASVGGPVCTTQVAFLCIVAGNGSQGAPTPGPATSSELGAVTGVALDAAGNLYITDALSAVVEKVTPSGTLSVVAGTGIVGTPTPGPATSSDLGDPEGVAVDAAGNLYIADTTNDVVEMVTPSGTLSVVAGTGSPGAPTPGPATRSDLHGPSGVALDAAGDLYIADFVNSLVEKVTPSGTLSVVAGIGVPGPPKRGPASGSHLSNPSGVTVDAAGNLYIADTINEVVEKVTPSGTLSVVAGTGNVGAPTPGPATSSDLSAPEALAVDAAGDLYIADHGNNVVEEVTPSGTLSVVAGTGNVGAPTPGPATSSDLAGPIGILVDAAGDLYIASFDVVAMVAAPASASVSAAPSTTVSPAASAGTSLSQVPPATAALGSPQSTASGPPPSASMSVSPAPSNSSGSRFTVPLVGVGVAVILLAGLVVLLVGRRRRRPTDGTVAPPAGGPPSFTHPPSPPPSP
jgi:sugar lactone lactonase YvrE